MLSVVEMSQKTLRRLQFTLAEIARQVRKHWAQFIYPAMAAGVLLMAGVSSPCSDARATVWHIQS